MELLPEMNLAQVGSGFNAEIASDVLVGNIVSGRTFARLVAPTIDISDLVAHVKTKQIPKAALLKRVDGLRFDSARVLAALEKENPKLANMRDEEVDVVDHHDGVLHVHIENTDVSGIYHLGVSVEGTYCAEHNLPEGGHVHDHGDDHGMHSIDVSTCGPDCNLEYFIRILSIASAVIKKKEQKVARQKKTKQKKRTRRRM